MPDFDKDGSPKPTSAAKVAAFDRTSTYYSSHSVIDHIKSYNAFEFVQYLLLDDNVRSAAWDPEKFAIHMVVSSKKSKYDLEYTLRRYSLEDGDYEAVEDNGWTVKTRLLTGELPTTWQETEDSWEYGLTDYRRNPIEITRVMMQKKSKKATATL